MSVRDLLDLELFRLHGAAVTMGGLASAVLIIAIGSGLSWGVRRAGQRALDRHLSHSPRNLQAMLRLAHYVIMLVAFAVALETVGLDLSALFAAGAIFAIGIGFAMQNIAQNFVSGVILLVERTIKPGDILEVDGTVVRVVELGLRATLVRTRFEEEMIVPNSLLVQSTIKNFTLHDSLYRVRTTVGVAYGSDVEMVQDTLDAAARSIHGREAARDPVVLLTTFGDSALVFEVSVWTGDPWGERVLLSRLNKTIWSALRDARIVIPFPQRDVHLDRDQYPLDA